MSGLGAQGNDVMLARCGLNLGGNAIVKEQQEEN